MSFMSKTKKNDTVLNQVEEKLVKELVSEGRDKGFVTIDEINENLGDETPSADQLEKIFEIFTEMDIEVIDSETLEGQILKRYTESDENKVNNKWCVIS